MNEHTPKEKDNDVDNENANKDDVRSPPFRLDVNQRTSSDYPSPSDDPSTPEQLISLVRTSIDEASKVGSKRINVWIPSWSNYEETKNVCNHVAIEMGLFCSFDRHKWGDYVIVKWGFGSE